jgi:hypothetical protein
MDGTVSTSAKLWPQRFDAAVVLVKHICLAKLFPEKKSCAKSTVTQRTKS